MNIFIKKTFIQSVVLGIHFIFPLFIAIFLIRKLPEFEYLVIMKILYLSTLINFFVEYGFGISATKYISENIKKIQDIISKFNLVIHCQIFLLFIAFPIIAFICIGIYDFEIVIFFHTVIIIIFHVLFPNWFFIALEKQKLLLFPQFFSKTIGIVFLFYLNSDQIIDYLIVIEFTYIVSFLWSIYLLKKDIPELYFEVLNFAKVFDELKNSFAFFISMLPLAFQNIFIPNIILLYAKADFAIAFVVVDRLRAIINYSLAPFFLITFPYFVKLNSLDKKHLKNIRKKFSLLVFILIIFFIFILFPFKGFFISLFAGYIPNFSFDIYNFLIFTSILYIINTHLYQHYLIIEFGDKVYNRNLRTSLILVLISFLPLFYYFNFFGLIYSLLLTEIFILTLAISTFMMSLKDNSKF